MAYQQVGTPRFYCNVLEWGALNGTLEIDDLFRTLPVNPKNYSPGYLLGFFEEFVIVDGFTEKNFVAVLGHNFSSYGGLDFKLLHGLSPTQIIPSALVNLDLVTEGVVLCQHDGYSIGEINHSIEDNKIDFYLFSDSNIGSIVIGTYYDMPHSPDLNLTLSYDHSGVKTIETRGGASLSNSFYSKPPMWGDLAAWELGDGSENQNLSRSGRKVWDLSFSYLSQEDTFPKYDQLNMLATSTPAESQPDQYTLQGSGDFYSEVVRKTQMQLPFIFQPNTDENSFAICKFDQKSFSFQQTAPSLYSVKCRIREVW